MIFQVVLIFFILQIGQELILADNFLDRNDFENFIKKKDENKIESPTNSVEQMIPKIEKVMENYSNKIVTDVDKSFEAELKFMTKDLKIFSNKSFNSTTEYLKKIIKREVESVKTIVKTIYRVLEAEKENFQDEITRGLRNMSRAKIEIVKNILKDELDQSARTELNELKISVKGELKKFARTELDYFKKSLKNEIMESSKNEFSLLKTFIITQLSLLKNAMENSFIRNSKKSTCELTKSAVETIKNMTEKSDSPSNDDSNLEQHMSILEDKFERVLLRLESKNPTCQFDEQTKLTFKSLKSVSEKLNHPDNNNNNEVCQKFEKVSDELSKNLTIGFNSVNIKVNSLKKSVSGKVIASSKSIESTVRDALTSELDKFSKTQLKSTKTVINDTLAGILETELESLKSTLKNQLKEQVDILKDKFNELAIKLETLTTQDSTESVISTINQIQNKLTKEFDTNTNNILNSINKTLFVFVNNDTLITSKKGKRDEKIKADGDIVATTPKDGGDPDEDGGDPDKDGGDPDKDGGDPAEDGGDPAEDRGDPAEDGGDPDKDGGDPAEDGEETPGGDVGVSSTTEEDGEKTPGGDVGVSSPTEEDGEKTPGGDVGVSSTTEEDRGETPGGDVGVSSPTEEDGEKTPGGDVGVSSTTEEDRGETPGGDVGVSSPTEEDGEKTPGGDVGVSSTTEEDRGETPGGDVGVSSPTEEDGEKTPGGDVGVSSTTEEDRGETPDGDVGVSSTTEETVKSGEE